VAVLCPRCGGEAPGWAEQCDNCGLALLETKARISQLGPYRVGDVAAERYDIRERGAVSALFWNYVAFDQEEEQVVALRAIRPTILPTDEDHEQLLRRAEGLSALDHQGLARHYRFDRDGQTSLVISERTVDGLPLRALIDIRRHDARAFSAQESIAVLTLVAEALEGAQQLSPHGDLEPDVIVLRDADLKVEAHGLAVLLPREETVRALASHPGSAGYLAPEVLEGTAFDTRSDVYSLAIIAYELLTGRVPPEAGADQQEILSHLPSVAAEVIRRALAHSMADRDASPLEMVEALAVVLGVEPLRGAEPAKASDDSFTDPAVAVEPDPGGTHPTMPRIPDPDELVATIPRDPAVPVEPAAEGTQQITADMLEPVESSGPAAIPKDPAVPVEAAAEGTQQITADMLEPVEDAAPLGAEDLDESRPTLPLDQGMDRGPEPESMRSLGLDPKLVRAARKLDRQRDDPLETPLLAEAEETAVEAPEEDVPTMRVDPSAEPVAPGPDEAEEPAGLDDNADTVVRASPLAGTSQMGLAAGEDEDAPSTEVVRESFPEVEAPAPSSGLPEPEDAELDDAELTERAETPLQGSVQELRTTPRARAEVITPLPSPVEVASDSVASPDEGVEPTTEREIPPSLVGDSVGPLQTSVAGRAEQSPVPPSRTPPPAEPGELPAVVVDDALQDAFGPAPVRDEPTHRVQRPEEPELPPIAAAPRWSSPPPAAREGGLKGWMLPVLVIAALGALLLGMGLALWIFG